MVVLARIVRSDEHGNQANSSRIQGSIPGPSSRETKESEWQGFFAENPRVLARSLPLALRPEYIVPLGRPGRTEPDFIFYPVNVRPVPFYGVIELKRPDSKIVTVQRSNVAILTSGARTAVEQGKRYVADLDEQLATAEQSLLCVGTSAYVFVIMGLSTELGTKLAGKLFREQVRAQLPANFQILPYDTLLRRFEASLPPQVMIVVPEVKQLVLGHGLPHQSVRFSHVADLQLARLLDFYEIVWQHKPRSFTLMSDSEGHPTQELFPTFYLPNYDLFIMTTTMDSRNVTRINRDARRARELYPELRIKVFYQEDYLGLLIKYGLEPPTRGASTDPLTLSFS